MNDNLSINNRLVSVNEGFNRGNMFDNLFWPYKYIAELKPTSEKEELMNKVQMYCFAAHEMNLYLDVYPENQEVLHLFTKYKDMYIYLWMKYEQKFGPLTLDTVNMDNNNWQWIKSPWPWEGTK